MHKITGLVLQPQHQIVLAGHIHDVLVINHLDIAGLGSRNLSPLGCFVNRDILAEGDRYFSFRVLGVGALADDARERRSIT